MTNPCIIMKWLSLSLVLFDLKLISCDINMATPTNFIAVALKWIYIQYILLLPMDTFKSKYILQFSRSVVSNSLRPHEAQHTRPPCPLPTSGVHPNPCPSSWWCHPTISSSVVPFSSCPQSLPASGSFPMSQLFASGGQSIGVSA